MKKLLHGASIGQWTVAHARGHALLEVLLFRNEEVQLEQIRNALQAGLQFSTLT